MEASHRGRPRPETDDGDESRADRVGRFGELADLGELDELLELEPPLDAEGGLEAGPDPDPDDEQSFRELRPQLRLRIWQIVPIVGFGALGSLMFAFPLAFESGGDGGPVVAMLGLLLSCCSACWGIVAARRVGYTWPGLPVRGSDRRPDWRVLAAYAVFAALVGGLAVLRVARLR